MAEALTRIFTLGRFSGTTPISVTGAQTTELIAADAESQIVVMSFIFTCSSDCVVRFEDTDAVALTGDMPFAAFGGPAYYPTTSAALVVPFGKGLRIVNSAGNLGGVLTWTRTG